MAVLPHLRGFFRNLLQRRQVDEDLQEEVQSYVDLLAEEKVEAGMALQEARRAARLEVGGVEQVKEEVRSVRSAAVLSTVLQDVRFGARMLRKSGGFTVAAVLTLAIGLGVNTAIFSVVEFLFRPLPVEDPSQLVVLATGQNGQPATAGFSYPEYLDLKQQANTFSDLMAYQVDFEGLSTGQHATQFFMSWVTGNYFSMLGVKPYLGRLFLPQEGRAPAADPYMVLGYSFWKREFHGDPNVIGRKVVVTGHPVTIIGVTPKTFHGTFYAFDTEGYLLFSTEAADSQAGGFWNKRDQRAMTIMGRLRPGATLGQTQSLLDVLAHGFAQQYPQTSKALAIRAYPEKRARPQPDPTDQTPLIAAVFLALAVLVTVLACMNVANLMLVRATVRQREMAVRTALGAARGRLLRQLLTESVLLGLLGGAAGLLLGVWAGKLLAAIPKMITQLPFQTDFGLDWRVFCYGFVAAVAAGVLVGILPARRAARMDLNTALHEHGRSIASGHHRVRGALVVAQVAGSVILLVVAGLFTRSLQNVLHANLGFDPSQVVTLTVDPHEMGYSEEQGRKFFRELRDRARTLPGVQAVCLAYSVPMGYYNRSATLSEVDGYRRPAGEQPPQIVFNMVGGDYFSILRIPLLRGRSFNEGDRPDAVRVAIVNQAMARRFWPGQDALGRRFKTKIEGDQENWFQVVGVVADAKYVSVVDENMPYFYVPLTQNYSAIQALHVRSSLPPQVMLNELQSQVHELAPDLPIFYAKSMREGLEDFNGFFLYRLAAGLAASLGLLGLLLAIVGVYGVVSYSANQRVHEIGIRMALGAGRGHILKLVLRNGVVLVGTGLLLGLVTVLGVARVVANFLVGVSTMDPLTFIGVAVVLAGVALAACYLPARRAMRVHPMVALRYE